MISLRRFQTARKQLLDIACGIFEAAFTCFAGTQNRAHLNVEIITVEQYLTGLFH